MPDIILHGYPRSPCSEKVGLTLGPNGGEAADALAAARATEPDAPGLESQADDPSGCKPGDRVTVTPDDSGRDPVAGELVACCPREVIVRRADPAVGTVHVHFLRAGFDLVPAG